MKSYNRYCPLCGVLLTYCDKSKLNRAIRNNSLCKKCSRVGDKNPMYGKESPMKGRKHTKESKEKISKNHADVSGNNNPMYGKESAMKGRNHTEESKEKIRNGNIGKVVSTETIEKMRNSLLGYYKNNVNCRKGKKHSKETKRKMRLSAIKRIELSKFNGVQFYPSYNKKSINIIEKYCNNNNLKVVHAENGGEYYIKELGYWVDAYDIKNNVIVEYNEKYHKYTIVDDIERRNNIINHLKCEFVIINEDLTIEIYNKHV